MNKINDIVSRQHQFFDTGITKDYQYRRYSLQKLKEAIIRHEAKIYKALKNDLNKSTFESYATEIGFVLNEIEYTIKHLKKWIKPQKVKTPLMHFISKSRIITEPYGVTLIMAPWNYPFQLAIAPLIGAIAAGNCAILKPSELAPHTSNLLNKMIKDTYREEYITVIEGGLKVNQVLLGQKLDYIFFTGSVQVGKIVMESASKNLIPVTLELGGKSPCIVDKSANLQLAAKRIIWGKLLNAGQTCVAPDYVMVHSRVKDDLIVYMKRYMDQFYGHDPIENKEFPRIINERHFNRLLGLMNSGNIVAGGGYNIHQLKIEPTLISDVSWSDPIMKEEIFGPLLPILQYDNRTQLMNMIKKQPKPLALYLFTRDKKNEKDIMKNISFGGGCINDTIIHLATPYMPFGGVGHSGMGSYHGKMSFDTFSHKKSIIKKSNLVDIQLRYPPYENKLKYLTKILK